METGIRARLSRGATTIGMGLVYFCVVTPLALLRRGFGGNPMRHKAAGGSFWKVRPEGERRSRRFDRQW